MSVDRDDLRANAKYLRNVRPIDPEEICEYLSTPRHPAVVRQALREEAVDLGLVEREDGTFVPVQGGPATVPDATVTEFPTEHARVLEDRLVDAYGPDWHRGASGDALREAIRRLKADYYHENDVTYDETAALGYAVYHLPDYYAVGRYVAADLARDGLLPRDARVLDLGAGVGGPFLGLADAFPADGLLEYHAVEPSPTADVLTDFFDAAPRNVHGTLHPRTAEAYAEEVEGEFDLVTAFSLLSELDDPLAVAESYRDVLAEDGTLVLVAPADRNTSIQLREIERDLEDGGMSVYAPSVRLWAGERPTDRGWSFVEKPDVTAPPFQRRLAEAAERPSEFLNETVKYSYSFLRADGRRRHDLSLPASRYAKLADAEGYVSNRVDLVAAKLSDDLSEGGNPLFKVSDGSEDVDCYAVLVNRTALNRDLLGADYGDLLEFESALCLWNDDEGAYNFVVDEDTVVDRLG
ncbi:class I SAM-dependent methyltransferase [Halarchaeum sp. CBA1220]|uniref:small ribosomal subunit Rsm22 family protein n=1 Tax=Halarchaeum sp. CBA1220 TaxID=1853682 RepID=UPI000F3A7FE2|nr:class I SAM-dependent methyltransferase [Halarchaeum sp. CBA1220]QLC34579.1 class I SAM-dependent methyltransferase [Halarchaeum sp. CBA1220]